MPARHVVAVLVRDGVMPLELGIVHQLFGSARGPSGDPLYEVVTCALHPGRLRTDADFTVYVEAGPETVRRADTVLVPASHEYDDTGDPHGAGPIGDPHATGRDGVDTSATVTDGLAEVLAAVRPGTRIASICTGAFVLAAAGLLDGRRATTHWLSADSFRRAFPRVRLDPDVLFTEDDGVFTSAGEAAGIDLCLHLIRTDHGAAVANDVARRTVVPPYRDGGQAQYIDLPVPPEPESPTARARTWALAHLDQPLTLPALAARASMSTRTFTRRFRREVGQSPGAWLTHQRLNQARDLLEQTDLPVDAIAHRTGFGTGASLRHHFTRTVGTSPARYRTTFTGKPPPA
jgi:transcriptional regulator GlxA family with amidase domain